MGVYCDVIRPLSFIIFHEWGSHICTCKTTFCTLQIWTKPQVGDFQQWHNLFLEYFLSKLTFSFIQINTSNIKFEIGIHQLNEKVNSTSGFDMFSILCSDFKVNFLRYWGWTVNSAMSVYVKFNILQNHTTNINEISHINPNFATYKCMSIPPHTYKCYQNINAICAFIIIILPDPALWAKISQIQCSSILSTRTQYGTSVQLYCKALT